MKESVEAFEARKRHIARTRAVTIPAPPFRRWTYNQHQTDEQVAAYYEGLKIVSQPGALYGPDEALAPGHRISVRFPAEPAYGPLSARTVTAKIERVREHPEFPYAVVVKEPDLGDGAELRAVVHSSWLV